MVSGSTHLHILVDGVWAHNLLRLTAVQADSLFAVFTVGTLLATLAYRTRIQGGPTQHCSDDKKMCMMVGWDLATVAKQQSTQGGSLECKNTRVQVASLKNTQDNQVDLMDTMSLDHATNSTECSDNLGKFLSGFKHSEYAILVGSEPLGEQWSYSLRTLCQTC